MRFLVANGTPVHSQDCLCEWCIDSAYELAMKQLDSESVYSQNTSACDCGGEKGNTTHYHWCSTNTSK